MENTSLASVNINNQDLIIKEINGKRVVTFKDIDELHQRPKGTAGRNFRTNRKYFVEKEDFYKICPDEIRRNKIMDISFKLHQDMVFLTETGYLMLVKSFTDKLAWNVQRQLVNNYFRNKQKQELFESRLMNLENSITQLTRNQNELINGQKLIYGSIHKALYAPMNTSDWKSEIYKLTKEIAELNTIEYKDDRAVLSRYYIVMRDTYGFVQDQSLKEYKERHSTDKMVHTIDLIADNKQYRSIFKNLLLDELSALKNSVSQTTTQPIITYTVEPIIKLIQKRQDNSPHGVLTYRAVYRNMLSKQAWKWHTTRYKNVTGEQNVKKSELVRNNEQLQTLFVKTVNKLLID